MTDPASRFDPASLTILKRLDDLETLMKARPNDPPSVTIPNILHSSSPSIPFDGTGSPVIDQQAQWKPSFINTEEVLRWPVFSDHEFDQKLHLLSPPEGDKIQPELLVPVDLDFYGADSFVRSFFSHVHIFNPTLKEEDIREYVRIVQFNGIGWDAMSCLLVSVIPSTIPVRFGS